MKIEYNFQGESFIYDVDKDEAIDYIKRTHSLDEILIDFIDEFYDEYTEEEIDDWIHEFNFDLTYDGVKSMSEEDKIDTVNEILNFPDDGTDLIEDSDIYYDELSDYFEQTAYDEFTDTKNFEKEFPIGYGIDRKY